MNRRARRLALLTVAAGCLVVAGLVSFNSSTVRDHAEAWWFVATRETKTASPAGDERILVEIERFFQDLAERMECPVIFDSGLAGWQLTILDMSPGKDRKESLDRGKYALKSLREDGWHIIEQRFPRRAYVVTGYTTPVLSETFLLPSLLRGASTTLELKASPQ